MPISKSRGRVVAGSLVCKVESNKCPVSAVLMHNTVLNEYVLDSATKSGTDWVVTDKSGKPLFLLDEAGGRAWTRRHSPEAGDHWEATGVAEKTYRVLVEMARPPKPRANVLTENDIAGLEALLAELK